MAREIARRVNMLVNNKDVVVDDCACGILLFFIVDYVTLDLVML